MDLLTQSVLGGALAQAGARRGEVRIATAIGLFAGVLADADALIRSPADPLLVLEYHRHFTHALAFIPIGALIAAALAWPFVRRRLPFGRIYLYALLGYCLAGLLDACTSYGTHLLWPLDAPPVAWSIVAIVDPVFTLALAVPLVLGWRARRRLAPAGLALAAAYLVIAAVQHGRAEDLARANALARGHAPERLLVKPTLGNILLWRAVYVADGRLWADGVRAGVFAPPRIYPGDSAPLLLPARDPAVATRGSRLHRDLRRFERFADGLLVRHPLRPEVIGDARYAMLPTSLVPLWGIAIDPGAPDAAPRFVTERTFGEGQRSEFMAMLAGR